MEEESVVVPAPAPVVVDASAVETVLRACGCTNDQKNALVGEGFAKMADFLVIQAKDVAGMCNNLARIPTNRGGSKIGTVTMKKVEALVLWCHDRHREGLDLDASAFDEATLVEYVRKGQLNDAGDQTSPEAPKDFKVLKWVTWVRKFETFLWQVKGKNEVPLIYVVRKERDPELPFNSEEERRVYAVNQKGDAFRQDNARVWNEMQAIMSDTPAWTWISKFEGRKDGKSAMAALREHYDGPGEVEKRISFAKRELELAHYRSEKTFTFEKYVTKLSEAFQILEENGIPKVEREKVDLLLEKMSVDNTEISAAIANIRMNPTKRNNFLLAANELSEYISVVMPLAASESGKKPARLVSEVRHVKKKAKTTGKGKEENGVDVSDLERSFSHQEWRKLTPETRLKIQAQRKAKKERRAISKAVTFREEEEHQDESSQKPKGNGGQFGSGAYNKNEKKRKDNKSE